MNLFSKPLRKPAALLDPVTSSLGFRKGQTGYELREAAPSGSGDRFEHFTAFSSAETKRS